MDPRTIAETDKGELARAYDALNTIGRRKLVAYARDLQGNPANTGNVTRLDSYRHDIEANVR